MIISIIGWYGTETMGDRAILDGILSIFSEIDYKIMVRIGSLIPFYTERTLLEEKTVFNISAPNAQIWIFDVKDKKKRKENIITSDIVVMGGGPLMDLEELYIIRDCFWFAKKHKIPTAILGCGVGPLKSNTYKNVVKDIFQLSTAISFRDTISIESAKEFCGDRFEFQCLGDPAVISVENYMKKGIKKNVDVPYVAVNFREYPQSEYGECSNVSDENLRSLLIRLADVYGVVKLVPMHTFCIGGDDRYYLSKLIWKLDDSRITVIHRPGSLYELYHCYESAEACIGMRYHSVLMQTLLNGNNYILDYTDPKTGKIIGFVKQINASSFYFGRTLQLQNKKTCFNPDEIVKVMKKNYKYKFEFGTMCKEYKNFIMRCMRC